MKIASTKIPDIQKYFRQELKELYTATEIELLITFCFEAFTGLTRTELIADHSKNVTESELLKFSSAIKQLKQNRPIQYILGYTFFYGLRFNVNEHVLIPRPETEELVDLIIKEHLDKRPLQVLDIGTGSGCIAVTLKKKLHGAAVTAWDISETALKTAHTNALLNNVNIVFEQKDILMEAEKNNAPFKFDCIVSNPPYISANEKASIEKNVLDYEPHLALFAPADNPFLFFEKIADFAIRHLNVGGKLYFELNALYGLEISELLKNKGFRSLKLIKDLNNKNRILRLEI